MIVDCFAGGGGASVGIEMALGFPKDYIIDRDYRWNTYPVSERVKRIGNSVVPIMAQKLVEANCPNLRVGVRAPNLIIDYSEPQAKIV